MTEVNEKTHREQVGFPTPRGIKEYADAFGMGREEFLDWTKSKRRVLDIGAGGGLLEKEIDILRRRGKFESDVKVIPLDIIYGTSEGTDFLHYATHLAFHKLGGPVSKKSLGEVDESFAASAVGGSFTDMPFPDESFDGILASFSFGIHARNKEQLMRSYKEVYRVLREGGEAFISVLHSSTAGTEILDIGSGKGRTSYSLAELEDIGFTTKDALRPVVDKQGEYLIHHWYLVLRKE
jgi:SAM-dependent methyltransferase